MGTHFQFLQSEWNFLFESALKAENSGIADPRTACFYCRRTLELAVGWLYKYDNSLTLPYNDNLSSLVHNPSFKQLTGESLFNKTKIIIQLGNMAVHSTKQVQIQDSITALRELFHFLYWLGRTYSRKNKPEPSLSFIPENLPRTSPIPRQTQEELLNLEKKLKEKDENLSNLLRDKNSLNEELEKLRAEIEEIRNRSASIPDSHNYSEEETRDSFIDLLLKEAGWILDFDKNCEVPVHGMPNQDGVGKVDYVLWGDDGKPLCLVEAKRTKKDPLIGQQQAKLYADCLEKEFGQRPVIFLSNGYQHYIWDDLNYPLREIQGFYKKSELEYLIQKREMRESLVTSEINKEIVNRYYQIRAITRMSEAFENDRERKTLLVMATGAGKTRTVIAAAELMIRCRWVKRILFLADRVPLVNQAVNAFKKHLPDSSPVNLVTEKESSGRVYVSTYQTMIGLINGSDSANSGDRKFGVGYFDLIVIDEAHRSIFHKYKVIFDYFDSLLIGLTATPKDEIDKNTYSIFSLETGVPTDAYSLEDAVKDKFLVPPVSVSVPLKYQREGISYDQLSEEEKEQWDEVDWDEEKPEHIDSESVNKWFFNVDTVDKVLEYLMMNGHKVEAGDRLGKTIIFAKNTDHAKFIQERFDANYPHYKGSFARIITYDVEYAQSLIDDFSKKDSFPQIAVSVDMMDTGIDVPEVLNLVFFKTVRSKTKFWQMMGRGTRLCENLFGPGLDKKDFYLFDFCGNLEYFNANPKTKDAGNTESISGKIFQHRLEILEYLNGPDFGDSVFAASVNPEETAKIKEDIIAVLHNEILSLNTDNFIVRPKRKIIEKYIRPEEWKSLKPDDYSVLSSEIAGLPNELKSDGEEAKRFDLMMLKLQRAYLKSEPAFASLKKNLTEIAALLEEKISVPMIRENIVLIQSVQSEEWWEGVTLSMLETVRKNLRLLIRLIEKKKRLPVYTDFEDSFGNTRIIDLPGLTIGEFEKFRHKAREFLKKHLDHISVSKLRFNKKLTNLDLEELEKILQENGVAGEKEIEKVKEESEGLGIFVRSLVGLDRGAAKAALGEFLISKGLNSNQIEFLDMILNYLTEHGIMKPEILYESPFTDIAPSGPEDLFSSEEIDQLIDLLHQVEERATA